MKELLFKRGILVWVALFLVCGLLFGEKYEVLSPQESSQLVDMLNSAGFDSLSLCFEKDWDLSTKYKLDWQLHQLQDPWRAFDDIRDLRASCVVADTITQSVPRLLQKLGGIAFNLDPAAFDSTYLACKEQYDKEFRSQVQKPGDIFDWLEPGLKDLNARYSQTLSGLDKSDSKKLTSFWMWQFVESEDVDKYDSYYGKHGLPDYDSLDVEKVRGLLGKIDFVPLLETGVRYLALADVIVQNAGSLKYRNKEPLFRETEFGTMVVGTRNDDVYKSQSFHGKPVCFLLEPAGNDLYENDLRTDRDNGFYLLIDLSGDDLYRSSNPAGMFCSTFGYGYSYDLEGNDIYQTDDYAFAALAGINLHQDLAGDDVYRSGLFSQGAAMCGVSLLLDQSGNDTYQASTTAQGLGSTFGAGAIIDQSGADTYTLGGKYYHEPLMPLDYITLGQGMGLGLRPELAGGLGLLYDGNGNDRYLGGVYAQGSGYWYATGALLDEAGNDVYNTVYYPQGSGIHLACGFLFDGAGDDAYYSRNGPGQGAGHDWALGILVDSAGNDAYSIPGGDGLGLTNSVGIFVDKSGDDRYERREKQNYGSANLVRSTGGLGLFLDAGGTDAYPDSLFGNSKTWQSGTYGIGRDIDLNVITKTQIEELAENAPLPDSTAAINDIFDIASEWEVGSAVQRVRKAREILLARINEAIPYALKNKISTDSSLEYRTLEAMAKNSKAFLQDLFPLIEGADSLAAKNCMSLISAVGDSLLLDYVERLLGQKKYETACLSVLSGVHTERAVQILSNYIFHPSERFRYIAARSLLQIKHPEARQTLLLMKQDPSFLVQALLRNLPPESKP